MIAAISLLLVTPAWAFSTVDEYAADFAKARECKPIDGRKVWAGKDAYYIQAWMFTTGQSGALDDEVASVVPLADNKDSDLSDFAKACQ